MNKKMIPLVVFILGIVGLLLFSVIPEIIMRLSVPLLLCVFVGGYIVNRWIPVALLSAVGLMIYLTSSEYFDYQSAPLFFVLEGVVVFFLVIFLILALARKKI